MDVLSMRTIFRCGDLARSRQFWEDVLGLTVAREYGSGGEVAGVVLFAGGGFVELTSGDAAGPAAHDAIVWLQVADVRAEEARLLAHDVVIDAPAQRMPWGLVECWLSDPDGVRVVLVETPPDHPLRRRVEG
ncbi:VOC family protein [Iamia sp.]|uniref:VOC family protein n=1 Tax=Iamia sp. TaxID=2722710 RepID=UPI002CB6427E|nr:VOC family protein [Iamia sp.]HXH57816.1 VOC family protein [Iamia sp.]